MTSPQPPRPQTRAATGGGVNEATLHLPTTTPGSAAQPPQAAQSAPVAQPAPVTQRTAPSPYPVRPPFRAPAPPPPAAPDGPMRTTGARPRPAPSPARPPQHWEGTGFRPDIQGLRAVAVALVLLSHVGYSFAAGGYVGVDVFFVVSGFLITSLLVKEVFDTGRISIAGFYARRARRILPAASAVTIATVVGAWLWFPVTRIEAVMQDAFTVIVYAVNYRFVATETEYLNADQMPSPFQQYWSLAVEEQFYVLWPLLLVGLLVLAKRDPRRLVGTALAACAGIFALSLVLSVLTTQISQPTAYYAAHTRIWELAAGAILALMLPTLKRLPKALAWVLGITGLAAIVASGVLYDASTPFPGYTALLPVLGTAAVIAAGSGAKNPASSLLATGPFQYVGKISYSLYLWHWPILILIPLAIDAEVGLGLNTVLLLATIAVAQLSYLYIEEPIRNARLLKSRHGWGLATGALSSVLGIALIVMFTVVYPRSVDDGPVDLEAVEEVENETEMAQRLQLGLGVETVPEDVVPPLAGIADDAPKIYKKGEDGACHLDFATTEPRQGCVFGDTESTTTVVLFGDSHAAQWFPALEAVAEENGWQLITRTKSSCTPVSVRSMLSGEGREYTECQEWRDNVFDELSLMSPDMVVVGSADDPELLGGDDHLQLWRDGWTSTLSRLKAAAGAVVTLTDTPWATGDSAPDCLSLHQNAVQDCLAEEPYEISYEERREAGMAAQQDEGATVIETGEWFCLDGRCPLIVDGIVVYRDTHHMSTPYAKSLTPLLAEALPAL
ncbi:acyltransferase family protein [Glycomyces scopariae]